MNPFQHVRVAVRMLIKSRTVTLIAVLTLALGVGLNTAVFSVLESIVLRDLPYPAAERLVAIDKQDGTGRRTAQVTEWTMQQWLLRSRSLDSIALYGDGQFTFIDHGEAEVWRGMRVSWQFFDTLGVKMWMGRGFAPDEDRYPRERAIILSFDLWQRRFGSDSSIVGRTIQLSDSPARVIGVLPPEFHPIHMSNAAEVPQVFAQAGYNPAEIAACHDCGRSGLIVARLRPSASARSAAAELTSITRELARLYPADGARYLTVQVEPLRNQLVGPVRRALWLLFGAVTFVMLIACANVAGIQLSRAMSRRREFAVRSALGAERRTLVAQLLTENLLLALVGGAAGVMTAIAIVPVLIARAPRELPRLDDVHVDTRVLLFTLAITLVSGLVFGMIPALTASRVDVNEALKRTGGLTGRTAGQSVRNLVVVVAVALAFALVVGTGLLGRTVMNLETLDAGFDGHDVLTLTPDGQFENGDARMAYLRTLVERVEAVPGVEAAGLVSNVPLSHTEPWPLRIEGEAPTDSGARPTADVFWVSPGYFRTLRIALKRGRLLAERDGDAHGEHAALISETLARQHFAGADPIGRRIQIGPGSPAPAVTIVGIIGDVRYVGLDRDPGAAVYLPQRLNSSHYARLVARTAGDPMRFERAIRSAIREIDSTQPVFHVQPMDEYIASSLAERRFAFALIALFGSVAFVLAGIGLYGLVSYSVLQRTPEIGIRVALGAPRLHVFSLVLREGMGVAIVGITAGFAIAATSARLLASLLFGVQSTDLPTIAGAAALLVLCAALASYAPARGALQIDPLDALKRD